jgi:mannose-6-phosphate isomerase-like protein (cupin superfamily)
MGVSVAADALKSESEAEGALMQAGLHVMRLDVPAVDNDAHWHHFDAQFYILSGSLQLTDVESGRVLEAPAGSRVTVPARTLHAERSAGYSIVLGTSVAAEAFGDPVNRPAETL